MTLLALVGLCLLLVAASTLSNVFMPKAVSAPDRLSFLDKARLAEALHLKQALGDQVFPGWGSADIPIVLFNQEFLFLTGLPDPADGWTAVPQGTHKGGPWQPMTQDDFNGQPYYRQSYQESNGSTQAFTVQIGGRWIASMGTYDFLKTSLIDGFRQELPPPLNVILPFRLLIRQVLPPDMYIGAVLHEAVHAYQGMQAPERLQDAENLFNTHGGTYPAQEEAFAAAWQVELDLLNQALKAESDADAARLIRDFLAAREKRRVDAVLSPEWIAIERTREWEEGLAKYGELAIMRVAADTPGYQPAVEVLQDPEFKSYRTAENKWRQEIEQIRREARAGGDGRFYYSGFAQAALLDRLFPVWKQQIFQDHVFLEDLLAQAVSETLP